ncbi:SAM-dependent methyltransferase [Candidatus Vidania fulgoroideae]|uniref:Ribosomal RNA large subunit methyltransferase E n=1 Tax=Candidatus Vidania fulgoroideorum TaxID=881286 RepID=A0A975AE95_9PROT|nr:SAM-dependent methyltransferase [Candidatus Vidania fulgoroideae]
MIYLNNLRSISFFKIMEIDLKLRIIKPEYKVLELGCFPGGWTQYILSVYKEVKLVSIDKDQIRNFRSKNFSFIRSNIYSSNIFKLIRIASKSNFNLIISDTCINISGIYLADKIKYIKLIKRILLISKLFLLKGGNLLFKIMLGSLEGKIRKMFRSFFRVSFIRLSCTKNNSSEVFVYCNCFRF